MLGLWSLIQLNLPLLKLKKDIRVIDDENSIIPILLFAAYTIIFSFNTEWKLAWAVNVAKLLSHENFCLVLSSSVFRMVIFREIVYVELGRIYNSLIF